MVTHGSGHGTELARVQEVSEQHSNIWSDFCVVEPGAELNDHYGSLPTQDTLWFYVVFGQNFEFTFVAY